MGHATVAIRAAEVWATAAGLTNAVVPGVSSAKLFTVIVANTSGATVYLQTFDNNAQPADTAVPLMSIAIPAHSYGSLDYGASGRQFRTGIAVVISTTEATLTAAGNVAFIEVGYRKGA